MMKLAIVAAIAIFNAPMLFQFFGTQFQSLHFLLDTKVYDAMVDYYRSSLPVVAPVPVTEVSAAGLTKEKFFELSENLQRPLVIRGGLSKGNTEYLGKRETWKTTYAKEDDWMICSDNAFRNYFKCSPKDIIEDYNKNSTARPDMLRGQASHFILYNNPDMMEALSTPLSEFMPLGNAAASKNPIEEMFFAIEGTRTPLHGAMGLNLFKQVAGVKKWTLIAPEHAFIAGMVNNEKNQGTTLRATRGLVLYQDDEWLSIVPRVDTILQPGDVLMVPAWWGHTIDNIVSDPPHELTIGSPMRFAHVPSAFGASWFHSVNAIACKGGAIIRMKLMDKWMGTKTAMSQDFFPLFEGSNAFDFDTFLIDNNIVKSTSGFRDSQTPLDEDW